MLLSLQDRGYLVADSLFAGIPVEYSGANPIFAAYVADATLAHNTIRDSTYSSICAGWGCIRVQCSPLAHGRIGGGANMS